MPVLTPQRRLQLVDRFARGLTHEVKNALNVLSLHVQALSDRPPPAEDLARSLKSFREQIGKIDGLVSRFCRFAAASAGGARGVDLGEVLSDVLALAAVDARHRHVTLEADLRPGSRVDASVAAALADALADLLMRWFDAAAAEQSTARLSLSEEGGTARVELQLRSRLPAGFREAARELARRADLDVRCSEREIAFAVPLSGRPGGA